MKGLAVLKVLVIQNCATEDVGLYEQYLIDRQINYEVLHPYNGSRFPWIRGYDAFLVGGTPISAYQYQRHSFLRREWRYLKRILKSNKPLFGICCGGQLLARLLGAKVRKNPVMEIGGYEVEMTSQGRNDPLLKGFPRRFPVFHWHGDTFDIPDRAQLLVRGEDCRNQLFRYNNAVAVQFHLEVNSIDAARWADQYAEELSKFHKTKHMVVEECEEHETTMRSLAYRLMDNFLGLGA